MPQEVNRITRLKALVEARVKRDSVIVEESRVRNTTPITRTPPAVIPRGPIRVESKIEERRTFTPPSSIQSDVARATESPKEVSPPNPRIPLAAIPRGPIKVDPPKERPNLVNRVSGIVSDMTRMRRLEGAVRSIDLTVILPEEKEALSVDPRPRIAAQSSVRSAIPRGPISLPNPFNSIVRDPRKIEIQEETGRALYRSINTYKDSQPVVYDLDIIKRILPQGMKIEDYEQSVLKKTQFSNQATRVINSLDALDPEVKGRMEAFIQRIRASGRKVSIRETRRPQERQEYLFQQGRSRPGNIVTWTLTSNHLDGRAIDILINNDTRGGKNVYEPVWKIAEEMGIKAIGEADPGHFEVVPQRNQK